MAFEPEKCASGFQPSIEEDSDQSWTPMFWHKCSFPPEIFAQVMMNLIRNPNINSSHLFRADVSLDCSPGDASLETTNIPPRIANFRGFELKTIIVRTMIPRNILVDKPLDQTCLIYERVGESAQNGPLVVYFPHIYSASESPFYHPGVRGIGFLHTYDSHYGYGTISLHYCLFDSESITIRLERTAQRLLGVIYKHGNGQLAGYVKRVHHDVILPQASVQNTYARLKSKYASTFISNWVEVTDPGKHVFEDLAIAAFLIELWAEMYSDDSRFPGFVDIGCGNGLLVHILLQEGYDGWGFDARKRKSWETYGTKTEVNLKEMILVPGVIQKATKTNTLTDSNQLFNIHDGKFKDRSFIISNHADELTPWTPILATTSKSPFMMIPCCSHNLTGAKFRAPAPKETGASNSAYASLVFWVSNIARDCGWGIEKEMLRIPSTRNTALIGRSRDKSFKDIDVCKIIQKHGGAEDWEANALKLVKSAARSH